MKLRKLLAKAFKAAVSPSVNGQLAPYFWGCIGWLSIASVFIPLLEYVEIVGGVIFFVIMTSLLNNKEGSARKVPSLIIVTGRSINVILNSLISGGIILAGLVLFIIPGVIASKQLIYYSVVAASENVSPIQVMKKSKKLSMANGYTLLAGTFIMLLPMLLLVPENLIGPLLGSLEAGIFVIKGVSIICNLLVSWLCYVVLNHMILIAHKEALTQINNAPNSQRI